MNIKREVLYLTGDAREKRKLMREASNLAKAGNEEVSVICRVAGRDYYVSGKHPFAAFDVYRYIRYERALLSPSPVTKKEARRLLARLGVRVSLRAGLGRLDVLTRRLVALSARILPDTATLAIDLDGAPYSRRLRRKLARAVRFLSRRYSVWVAVTDSRLIPAAARRAELRPGVLYTRARPVLRSRVVSRALLRKAFRACGAEGETPVVEKGRIVQVVAHR